MIGPVRRARSAGSGRSARGRFARGEPWIVGHGEAARSTGSGPSALGRFGAFATQYPLLNIFQDKISRHEYYWSISSRFTGKTGMPSRVGRAHLAESPPGFHQCQAGFFVSGRGLASRRRLTASLKSSVQIVSGFKGTGCIIFTSFASSSLGRSHRSGT